MDDSPVIRNLFTKLLGSDPELEVVGTAPDPFVAREKLVELKPDVMTLDIEMPRMDGLTFLEKVMAHFPTPTVVISSLTEARSGTALRALELGAVEVIGKPNLDPKLPLAEVGRELCRIVKGAARARIQGRPSTTLAPGLTSTSKPTGSQVRSSALGASPLPFLALASSTGGTEALKHVLPKLHGALPAILIVQHMPPVFTKTYAETLSKICAFPVREAVHGERILAGQAYIAPGDFHMEVEKRGTEWRIKLHQAPLLHGVRPAADFLFESIAKHPEGANAVCAVLTGMGRDGAKGLLALRTKGAYVVGQNEETCVVFGMPRAANDLGAVDRLLPIDQIADALMSRLRRAAAA